LLLLEMYGHIHMMNTQPKPLNMKEELYIDALRESVTYCIPAGLHEWSVNALLRAMTGEEKIRVLETLLKVCNAEGCFGEGINVIDRVISDPDIAEHRSRLLFLAGQMSEGLYEYDKATGYYARSLACPIRTKDQHIATVNKLGFCDLYRQDFKGAEEWSRWAIKLGPHSWEAWKNLGVSLEHQGQIEEAFLAYYKAVSLSRGRAVPVMHLIRLSQRHPGVVPDVGDLRPMVYREYEFTF
jgi:tetratricopeptide (TPR) repeat protein